MIAKTQTKSEIDDTLDVREIDQIVSEASGMAARWTLFCQFVENSLSVWVCVAFLRRQFIRCQCGEEDQLPPQNVNVLSSPLVVIEASGCKRLFDNLLRERYLPLELWYMRYIVDKVPAHYPVPNRLLIFD